MTTATLALDIGATKTLIGLVRRERAVSVKRYATAALLRPGGDITVLLERIRAAWKPNIGQVGVGVAGPVRDGAIEADVNFPTGVVLKSLALERRLELALGVPVTVLNDAHCFALGEATYGAGWRYRRVVGVTLGTGVGGGVVIDGELYRGEHQVAGEFGHLPFTSPPTLVRCGCGQVGHLESVLSGPGLSRLYAEESGRTAPAEAIVQAAGRGDFAARRALRLIEDALVHLVLTIVVTWDPAMIVIGGGFAEVPRLIIRARHRARHYLPYSSLENVRIVPSLLHDQAVLLGAALAADRRRGIQDWRRQRRPFRRTLLPERFKKLTNRFGQRPFRLSGNA